MSGTTPRRPHGPAGLLAILFVVGGLIFSYGLGHAPVQRVCTEHAVSAPLGAVPPGGAHQAPQTGVPALQGLHGLAHTAMEAGAALQARAPLKEEPPQGPACASLCLAVLLTLVLVGLAAGLRRPAFRLPARTGWILAPPSAAAHALARRPSLQVLRL